MREGDDLPQLRWIRVALAEQSYRHWLLYGAPLDARAEHADVQEARNMIHFRSSIFESSLQQVTLSADLPVKIVRTNDDGTKEYRFRECLCNCQQEFHRVTPIHILEAKEQEGDTLSWDEELA